MIGDNLGKLSKFENQSITYHLSLIIYSEGLLKNYLFR